jgi:hypothetical protein
VADPQELRRRLAVGRSFVAGIHADVHGKEHVQVRLGQDITLAFMLQHNCGGRPIDSHCPFKANRSQVARQVHSFRNSRRGSYHRACSTDIFESLIQIETARSQTGWWATADCNPEADLPAPDRPLDRTCVLNFTFHEPDLPPHHLGVVSRSEDCRGSPVDNQ